MSHGIVILTFRWTLTWSRCSCASRCPFICWLSAVLPHQQDPGTGLEAMGQWHGQGVRPHGLGLAFGSVEERWIMKSIKGRLQEARLDVLKAQGAGPP